MKFILIIFEKFKNTDKLVTDKFGHTDNIILIKIQERRKVLGHSYQLSDMIESKQTVIVKKLTTTYFNTKQEAGFHFSKQICTFNPVPTAFYNPDIKSYLVSFIEAGNKSKVYFSCCTNCTMIFNQILIFFQNKRKYT